MSVTQKPWEVDLTVYRDEAELLMGLQRHDRLACTCLLKQFAPRLLRFATQVVGDADEAEDILQESLIRACASIESFAGRSGLGTWMHRIVLNMALSRLRHKHPTFVPIEDDGGNSSTPELPPSFLSPSELAGPEPDRSALGHELRDQLDRGVLALPSALRTAFVLRHIEGRSTHEAAEALGISEAALKVRLHRARMALRETLALYLEETATPVETGS